MGDKIQLTDLFLGTAVLLMFLHCDCRPLDGYAYPVYTTESCPRNLTDWRERSTDLNCTKTNAYMCVPDENITELLEFCYSLPQIQITKGICMFLYKRHSTLDGYNCSYFTEGCPSSSYRSQDVHQYQSCVSIANGCFLDDPRCNRTKMIHHLTNSTNTTYDNETIEITQHERKEWVWMVTLSGVTAITFIAVCILSLIILKVKAHRSENTMEHRQEVLSSGIVQAVHVKEVNKHKPKVVLDIPLLKTAEEAKVTELDVTTTLPATTSTFLFSTGPAGNSDTEGRGSDNTSHAPTSTVTEGPTGNENTQPQTAAVLEAKMKETQDESKKEVRKSIRNESAIKKKVYNNEEQNSCLVSPLVLASVSGQNNIVKHLLKEGANINSVNETGHTPLAAACYGGLNSTIHLLLTEGADINVCQADGSSPLYVACFKGYESTVRLLLSKGADINLCETARSSPLFVACQNGHDKIAKLLLQNGADINLCQTTGASPLFVACIKGNESTVQLLLANGADINLCRNDGSSPLYVACQKGHDNIAKLLLQNGADINLCMAYGTSPLCEASIHGNDSTVQLLLTNGADINLCQADGSSPLYVACFKGNESTVRLLLSKGADVNLCMTNGVSPLYVACVNGYDSIAQLLLYNGADINLCMADGTSPLYISCQKGNESTVQLLLNNGANIGLCSNTGYSPLSIASHKGHERIVQLLLHNGI